MLARTTYCEVKSLNSPVRNPFTTRDGIPRVRSMTAMDEAKYSQCPCLRSKRKLASGIMGHRARELQSVAKVSAEIGLQGAGLVVIVVGRSGNLLRELRNATVKRRQLKIAGDHVGRVGLTRCLKVAGRSLPDVGKNPVAVDGMLRIQVEDRASVVHAQVSVKAFKTLRRACHEENVHAHRLHQHAIGNQARCNLRRTGTRRQ